MAKTGKKLKIEQIDPQVMFAANSIAYTLSLIKGTKDKIKTMDIVAMRLHAQLEWEKKNGRRI